MAPGFPAQVIADARAAAKIYARVAQAADDGLLDRLAASALALAESFLRVSVIVRPHRVVLPAGSGWQRLPVQPVTAIAGVSGLPADGAEFALPVGGYAIDVDADGVGWVRVTAPGAAGRVAVSYSAGLATDWAGVPAGIAQGVVRLIAHLHAERDGGAQGPPPAAVTALWRPFRRLVLAERGR